MKIEKIPLADIKLGAKEGAPVTVVLKPGCLSISIKALEFEYLFVKFWGIEHAVNDSFWPGRASIPVFNSPQSRTFNIIRNRGHWISTFLFKRTLYSGAPYRA
jgi:hypothetical protein